MERHRVLCSPPRSPKTKAGVASILDQTLANVKVDHLTTSPALKGPRRMKRWHQSTAFRLMSKLYRRSPQAFLLFCSAWIFFSLLWIRWPIYDRIVFSFLKLRLGESMEVEPLVVSVALVIPFFLGGLVFYWNKETMGTQTKQWVHLLKVVQWVRKYSNIGKSVGFDAIDTILVSGFLLLQLNVVVGKLLIDMEHGALAKSGVFIRTGRAFGMSGLYAMIVSVILVAKQSFVHEFFGLSSERATRYHVLSGQFGFTMLLLHSGVYLVVWYTQGKLEQMLVPCLSDTCSSKQRYKSMRNFSGMIAILCFSIVAISSMEWVRRRYFRRFVVLHGLTIGVIVFTVLHYYATCFWLVPLLVLYVMYRISSIVGRGKASVLSATVIGNKVVELELRRATFGKSDFLPGQFVYIRVKAIENEWHPFTLSSSPLRNRHSFFLMAKPQGFFTSQLVKVLKTESVKAIDVDGYYGTEVQVAPHMVFVAGGSGMTPFLSVLEHLKALLDMNEGDQDSTDCKVPQTLWIIWTCRDTAMFDIHFELLGAINECTQWQCKVWLHCTQAVNGTNDESGGAKILTENHNGSEASSPRSRCIYPSSLERYAFYGHNDLLGLPLFIGTAVGCVFSMMWVLNAITLTPKSFSRRLLLLGAGVFGAVLGASLVSYLLRRKACKDRDDKLDIAMEEVEIQGLDVSSSAVPLAPQSGARRHFLIDPKRPDLGLRLCAIHNDIRKRFGVQANVVVYVSGPAELQFDTLKHARELQAPTFDVYRKSFLL